MEDIEITPVDGAIWVRPHESAGHHVRGYWRLPNGEVLDDTVAEEIIRLKRLKQVLAANEALPSESLKKSHRKSSDSIDPTDVSSIVDKGKQLESELGVDPSESLDVQAKQLASKLSEWMSAHAKGGNGDRVMNAVGRYADELNESISVLPNTVKNLDKPGYVVLVDSTQGSKVGQNMKGDMTGYFYSGRMSLPPAPVDEEIKKTDDSCSKYENKKRELMRNAKVGSVLIDGFHYDGKEGFENGSNGTTALMKINDGTVRKVVFGQKFSCGKGSSLRKIADDADVVVYGYSGYEEHVKAPVYEVKERHEASGSAIIVKKPHDKDGDDFKRTLMHEYVHYLQASSRTFTEAAKTAYERFDGGVDTDKDAFEGRTHRGFGIDALDYASTNPDEFMSEASSMLFHPSAMMRLMSGSHATRQEAHDTNRVRQWALGFWASVADGSIEV